MSRKKILWITSWYPNRNDPFDGDFIQRHARAAAIHHDIYVLFVTPAVINSPVLEEVHEATGLIEHLIYYKQPVTIAGKGLSWWLWFKHSKKAVKNYIHQYGLPFCVHIHIPWKAGLVGLWIKKKYNIPFIVTEHWGIYNTVEKRNILTKSKATQQLIKKIFTEASAFISVSRFLGDGVNQYVTTKSFILMPNVVDTTLFHQSHRQDRNVFNFIHVSNGAAIKNIQGIIEAFAGFSKKTTLASRLIIVGTKEPELKAIAERAGLTQEQIFFIGTLSYPEVAAYVRASQALVLFSYMENAPCVIGEALCCGLPVIATAVGGIPELVSPAEGILVPPSDVHTLSAAMHQVIDDYHSFDTANIAQTAQKKFSYTAISQQFAAIYDGIKPLA